MQSTHAFLAEILADGKLDHAELGKVCDRITADNLLDVQDVELLTKIYVGAKSYPAEFEDLFFGVLKAVILDDDKILNNERFFLLQMLYSNSAVREVEIEFLKDLQREATEVSPEFEQMIIDAEAAFRNGENVGGRPT